MDVAVAAVIYVWGIVGFGYAATLHFGFVVPLALWVFLIGPAVCIALAVG